VASLAVFAIVALNARPALAENAVGNWFGAMDLHLLTFVHIEMGGRGLTGSIDTHELPAGPKDHTDHAPLANLSATPDRLTFHFSQATSSGIFNGSWNAAKKGWSGQVAWEDGRTSPLILYRTTATTLVTAKMPPQKEVNDTCAFDKVAQAYLNNLTFMGAVLVARGDRILLDKAYGFANETWKIPTTTNTRFLIASVSKQFAAASILMLEEQGKLNVDDPVSKYIPGTPEAWKQITIHQLLTHTSGVPNTDTSDRGKTSPGEPVTPDQIIADAQKRRLDFSPDSRYGYSNTNYTLLARIVENVSGDTYAAFLARHIFEPLGMEETSLDNGIDLIPRYATSYDLASSSLINASYEDPGWTFGAGSVVTTTHDLLRWERGLMGGKVLSPATLQRMLTPYKNRYGYGVVHNPFLGYSVITHNGLFRGFSSTLSYFPDDKLTVIVLNNLRSDLTQGLADKLAMVAHGVSVSLPPARAFAHVSSAVLKTYAGTYMINGDTKTDFSVDGNKLIMKKGDATWELSAQSDTRFFLTSPEINIQFVQGDDGKMSMVYEHGGQKINTRRTD
jgi:CubicO group peptidase (beta-lactamase class C family)